MFLRKEMPHWNKRLHTGFGATGIFDVSTDELNTAGAVTSKMPVYAGK
jgi:hypothetical protein